MSEIAQKLPESLAGAYSRGRLAGVDVVYFQAANQSPQSTECRFSRMLVSEDLPYTHPLQKVGEDWIPFDLGWLKDCGCSHLVVRNHEGKFVHVQPTEEQRKQVEARVLQIGVQIGDHVEPIAFIPPSEHAGESSRFSPVDITKLRIRCLSGEARFTATIFPS